MNWDEWSYLIGWGVGVAMAVAFLWQWRRPRTYRVDVPGHVTHVTASIVHFDGSAMNTTIKHPTPDALLVDDGK